MAARPRLIVPLRRPPEEEAAARAAAPPHLTYHGGPLLTNVEVFTIFWGAAWQDPAQVGLVNQVNQFFDFILTSSLLDLLAEYGVPGKAIGHGKRTGTKTITASEPGGGTGTIDDTGIQQALQGWIADGTVPQPTANSLYFLYFPPGVTITLQGQASCQVFCGYHNVVGGNVYYAVEPYITCAGCTFGQIIDSLTKVSSHELCEAITDPALTGWIDDNSGNEIGDICNSTTATLGGYTIQDEWSNTANACLDAPAGTTPAPTPTPTPSPGPTPPPGPTPTPPPPTPTPPPPSRPR